MMGAGKTRETHEKPVQYTMLQQRNCINDIYKWHFQFEKDYGYFRLL